MSNLTMIALLAVLLVLFSVYAGRRRANGSRPAGLAQAADEHPVAPRQVPHQLAAADQERPPRLVPPAPMIRLRAARAPSAAQGGAEPARGVVAEQAWQAETPAGGAEIAAGEQLPDGEIAAVVVLFAGDFEPKAPALKLVLTRAALSGRPIGQLLDGRCLLRAGAHQRALELSWLRAVGARQLSPLPRDYATARIEVVAFDFGYGHIGSIVAYWVPRESIGAEAGTHV